jgi:hypothetical protein
VNPLFAAAVSVELFCRSRGWRCCIIGGLAVQRWGDPRQTRDVDLTILTGLGGEEQFIDPLLEAYRGRIPNARAFALDRRVVLAETADGTPLDISLAGLPYEARVIERSSAFQIAPATSLTTCSSEDLIVLKAFADRPQDWLDIEGIVVRQGNRIDRALLTEELTALLLLKEDPEPGTKLERLLDKHGL